MEANRIQLAKMWRGQRCVIILHLGRPKYHKPHLSKIVVGRKHLDGRVGRLGRLLNDLGIDRRANIPVS